VLSAFAGFYLGLPFDSENGSYLFYRSIGLSLRYTALQCIKPYVYMQTVLGFITDHSIIFVAAGYRLDGRGVTVRVPVGARIIFLHAVRTVSGAHRAFYPIGTGSSFPGAKAAGTRS
jgi:hypothetical protein